MGADENKKTDHDVPRGAASIDRSRGARQGIGGKYMQHGMSPRDSNMWGTCGAMNQFIAGPKGEIGK